MADLSHFIEIKNNEISRKRSQISVANKLKGIVYFHCTLYMQEELIIHCSGLYRPYSIKEGENNIQFSVKLDMMLFWINITFNQ